MVGVVNHFAQRQTLAVLSTECGECRLQICAEKGIFFLLFLNVWRNDDNEFERDMLTVRKNPYSCTFYSSSDMILQYNIWV